MRLAFVALLSLCPSSLHAAPPVSGDQELAQNTEAAEAVPVDATPAEAEAAEGQDQVEQKQDCPEPEPGPDKDTGGAKDPLEGNRDPPGESDVLPTRTGFAIALRTGWAIPQGDIEQGVSLAEGVVGAVPFWLDLGFRATDELMIGVYMQYAHVLVRECAGPSGCNASDVRFGFQAQWHFGARDAIDHWVGVGAGFEIYDEDVSGTSRRLAGYELLNLQAGEDLSLGRRFGLGPFVSFSLGKFTTGQRFGGSGTAPIEFEIESTALHTWVILGLRFSFGA
jgi:hypothetical protein